MESLLWFLLIPKHLGSLTNQNLDTTKGNSLKPQYLCIKFDPPQNGSHFMTPV